MNIESTFRRLQSLYNVVVEQTESFEEQAIGADLAYLMGAILNDTFCEWSSERPLVKLLKRHKDKHSWVWGLGFIRIVEETQMPNSLCKNCGHRLAEHIREIYTDFCPPDGRQQSSFKAMRRCHE